MTDDIYRVINRINDIRKKFGMKRHNPSGSQKNINQKNSFSNILRKSLDEKSNSVQNNKITGNKYTKYDINRLVDYYSNKNRVPSSLMKSIIKIESDYNPNALSKKGAMGLMQIMPSIAKEMGVDNPFKPEDNINAGVKHFKGLLDTFNGDYKKALSAYNAGKAAVLKHNGVPDYKETRDYIGKVIKNYIENK